MDHVLKSHFSIFIRYKMLVFFFLACASLAKPLNCLAVSAVESPEATVEFRQRTLVDNVGHRLDAATGAEWIVLDAPLVEARRTPAMTLTLPLVF